MSTVSQPPAAPRSVAPLGPPPVLDSADAPSGLFRISQPVAVPERPLAGLRGVTAGQYTVGAGVLRPGARVGILCDTLHGDPEIGLDYGAAIRVACELIASLGYEPVVDEIHARVAPYCARWAGSAQERGQHVVRLLDALDVDALYPLFGKGGGHDVIGAMLDTGFAPRRPVALIGGFSHHTDWSLFALSPAGRRFFSHVVSVTQAAYWKNLPTENVDNLRCVLHEADSVRYAGLEPLGGPLLAPGSVVRGPLAGGNMGAVLLSAARRWMPSFAGTIALCEDYDKHPHDFHRGFGAFAERVVEDGARAIVVGSMLPLKKVAHAKLDKDARKVAQTADRAEILNVVQEIAAGLPIPVFHHQGLFGHGALNCPIALGGHTELRVQADGSASLRNELALAPRFGGAR